MPARSSLVNVSFIKIFNLWDDSEYIVFNLRIVPKKVIIIDTTAFMTPTSKFKLNVLHDTYTQNMLLDLGPKGKKHQFHCPSLF